MKNRYRIIGTLLMAAVLAGTNVMAQSTPTPTVNGNVFGGGNEGPVEGNTTVNIGETPAP